MGICICVAESLHCPPETITTLLSIKVKKKNKTSNRASVAAVERIKGENEMRTEGLQGTL